MINTKKKNIILIGLLVSLLLVIILVSYGLRMNTYENAKTKQQDTLNPGRTGGDYSPPDRAVGILRRGELVRVIRERNTEDLERTLLEYLRSNEVPLKGGKYIVKIENDEILPSDPPMKWHYKINITVNEIEEYTVSINADPESEFEAIIIPR